MKQAKNMQNPITFSPAPGIEVLQVGDVQIARVGNRFVSGAELLAAIGAERRRRFLAQVEAEVGP